MVQRKEGGLLAGERHPNGDPVGPNGLPGRLVAFPRAIGFEREVPQGFDQNGSAQGGKAQEYVDISRLFDAALGRFASNLNGASNGA